MVGPDLEDPHPARLLGVRIGSAYALAQRTYQILFWVGLFSLIRGFSQIVLAFEVRHAGMEAIADLHAAA